MQAVNHALFLWINAPEQASAGMLALALFCAKYLIWTAPALVVIGWISGDKATQQSMLIASLACLLGLLINLLIGHFYFQPRPFAIGLGQVYLHHAANFSFPSNHLLLWCCVSFTFLRQPGLRPCAWVMLLLGLPIAWARIYLGVHFPLDMLGSVCVAAFSVFLLEFSSGLYLEKLYFLATRIYVQTLHFLLHKAKPQI